MDKGLTKLILIGSIVFFLIIFSLQCFITIGAGERGVILNFGAVDEKVLNEGLHFILPIKQKVIKMDVKIQKSQTDSDASTKDLQDTSFIIVVNYHLVPNQVWKIYQEIGLSYKERIIDPSVQEVVKAVSAKYTAEELITQRDVVSREIKDLLKKKLIDYDIIIDNFSIVNFSFSDQFVQAIEEKQTAEQKALKAQRDLQRVKFEAQQKIEQASAEAKALRLKKTEVTTELIELKRIEAQLEAIEKWDGKLPKITSDTIPFISVDDLK